MSFGDLKVQDLIYEDSSNNEITVVIADLATKANPVFSGTVTVPTATAGDNSTKAASTAFVVASFAPKNAPAFTGSATGVNLTLSGDLTVNGTTTTINTTTLQVEDKNIEIGKVASPSDTTADGGGWTLLGSTNKTFNWLNATDSWTSSEHIEIASGKNLKVDGTTFFVDGTNNRVGIGLINPGRILDCQGSSNLGIARVKNTASSIANTAYTFMVDSSAHTSNVSNAGAMSVDVNSGRALTIDGLGRVGIGTTTLLPYNASGDNLVIRSSGTTGLTLSGGATDNCNIFFGNAEDSHVSAQINYDNDTNLLRITAGESNGVITFCTVSSNERLRIGNAGQLGIAGANYGSSGQVLTSGGSGAAPSWANPAAGGNTVDLVADGAIAAGKPVIISSTGKVKQVGNEMVKIDGNPTYAGTVLNHYLNDGRSNVIQTINCGTNLILSVYYKTTGNAWNYNVTYIDSGQQNVAKASTNGNTDSALGGVSSNSSIALAYLGNNKVCIFYNGVTAGQVHALIAEINPSTRAVTFGSAVQLGGGNCRNCAVSYDTDNSRILFCWNNVSVNSRGYYRSASFSGTTITTLGSGASEFPRIGSNYGIEQIRNVYDTSADRHVVTFNYQDNSNDGCAFSVQTTGSAFTAGSLFTFTTGTVNNSMGFESCFDSVNNRTIITWAESTSGARFKIRGLICNASTGAITAAGSTNNGGGDWYPYYSEASMVFNTGLGTAYLLAQFREGSSGNYWIVVYVLSYNSSAGTYSSTAGWAIYASTNQRRYLGLAAFNNTNNELQIVSNRTYESSSSSRYHDVMRVITMSSQSNFSSDQRNFLGFAEDAISDGNTGTITLAGNIVGNQSGLTPGLLYKTNNDGTLTQSWGNGEVGLLAIASDKGQVVRSLQ